jgi:hypothetical protein
MNLSFPLIASPVFREKDPIRGYAVFLTIPILEEK